MSNEERVTYFAQTDSRNRRVSFGIKAKDRTRHMYVIGKTGMGKSTLLENMAVQDIRNGEGMAFIDPHGKSADLLLDYVPKDRVKDVLYFAPFDMEHPVGFNVMEDVHPDRRHLVVNGLMSTFEKIWEDAWSARMSYILQNTIHALLEYPDATLLDVNRMYTNKEFRTKVVENIDDPSVRSFWVDEYAKYTDRYTQEATPAIQNKVGQLASNPVIRNIIGQPKSSFDIRELMDDRKIFIVNLSKGKIGEMNANLLGSMLINKIYLGAMSRADVTEAELERLPNFYTFIDEFQSFANRSFADILSESRKYKLNLTMAHQYIEQMSEEVRAAVFGNVGTMISFRVGAFDAEILEKEFAPNFTAEDIVNLGFAQIYLKLMIDGVSSPPFSAQTIPPMKPVETSHREEVIQISRQQFAGNRQEIEQVIRARGTELAEKDKSGAADGSGKGGGEKDRSGSQGKKKQANQQKPPENRGGAKQGAPKKGPTSQGTQQGKSGEDLRAVLASLSAQVKQETSKKGSAGEKNKVARNQSQHSSRPSTKTDVGPAKGKGGSNAGADSQSSKQQGKPPKDARNQLREALKKQGLLSQSGAPASSQKDAGKRGKREQGKRKQTQQSTRPSGERSTGPSPEDQGSARASQESSKHESSEQQTNERGVGDKHDAQKSAKPSEVPKEVLDKLLHVDGDDTNHK